MRAALQRLRAELTADRQRDAAAVRPLLATDLDGLDAFLRSMADTDSD